MSSLHRQLELFEDTQSPTAEQLASFKGHHEEKKTHRGTVYITYITAPRWNDTIGEYTCLANVEGMLCIISVKIRTNHD